MIRKLKFKFILTNMALITVVLAIVFASLYINTYQSYRDGSKRAMEAIIAGGPRGGKPIFEQNEYSYFNGFYITLTTEGEILGVYGYNSNIDSDKTAYLQLIANAVIENGAETGIIENENLRYYMKSSPREIRIVFLDRSDELSALQTLIKTSLLVGIIALFIVFIISWIIAKISITPVERSINQQKQLVSDVSHELKTPITIIRANADVLLSNAESTVASQRKWIDYIKSESDQMTALINNMLYLAKTDEDKSYGKKNLTKTDISDLLTNCTLSYEIVCFEQHRRLETEIVPSLFVNGDESALKQLITIILDNACKYSDENGMIRVLLFKHKDSVILSVNNTGAPIPADEISHIFERFYRVEKSRSREKGGYGLGLSIAKTITETHGGKISAQSTEADGTTFIIKLPAYKGE